MEVPLRHGKRRRDSDVPPPQMRQTGGPAHTGAPSLVRPASPPPEDGLAVRRRRVERSTATPPATDLRPAETALRLPALSLGPAALAGERDDSALATDPPLVAVRVQGQVRYARARFAEMDEGLVTARRAEAIDGLYSTDFASCRAVILTSAAGVGLSHTSSIGDGFLKHVKACRAEFREEFGEDPSELVIGASDELHRAGLEDEWAAHGGADFLRSEQMAFGDEHAAAIHKARAALLPEPTEDAVRRSDVQVALEARLLRLHDETRRCGATQPVRLPHGAVMVPLDGPIDLLDGPPPRAVSPGPLATPHLGRTDRKCASDAGRSDGTDRGDRPASLPDRAAASHRPASPAAELAEPGELAHGAIVTVSHGAQVLYPHAWLVVDDGELVIRRADDASTGLLAQDVTRKLVLALIGPPSEVMFLSGSGPQPTATALIRLDPREDYQQQADSAVNAFSRAAGRPIQALVGVATEDLEAHVIATMDGYSAEGLLEEYGVTATPPAELAGDELSHWLLERILDAHNGRADDLAARYGGLAIPLPNNAVFLDPSGELDVFTSEPDVTLAPCADALARAGAAQRDALLPGAIRRADDEGVRPTRPSPVARDARAASAAAGAPLDGSEPPTLSGGSRAKPLQ